MRQTTIELDIGAILDGVPMGISQINLGGVKGPKGDDGGVIVRDVTGTTYTVVTGDNGKILRFTNNALVTVTLPVGVPIDHISELLAWGTAGVAVQGDGSSTVQTTGTIAQYKAASVVAVATNTWSVLFGA